MSLNCSTLPTVLPLDVFPLTQLKLVNGYVSKKLILDESVLSKYSFKFLDNSKSDEIFIDLLDNVSILYMSFVDFNKLSIYSVLYLLLMYVCQLSPCPLFDIFLRYVIKSL